MAHLVETKRTLTDELPIGCGIFCGRDATCSIFYDEFNNYLTKHRCHIDCIHPLPISESFWSLAPDCLMVLGAEFFVDWLKHAFITRFNEVSAEVYKDYTISLAYDLATTKQKHVSIRMRLFSVYRNRLKGGP